MLVIFLLGIRIEDNILFKKFQVENLTEAAPKSVKDIEEHMKNSEKLE